MLQPPGYFAMMGNCCNCINCLTATTYCYMGENTSKADKKKPWETLCRWETLLGGVLGHMQSHRRSSFVVPSPPSHGSTPGLVMHLPVSRGLKIGEH